MLWLQFLLLLKKANILRSCGEEMKKISIILILVLMLVMFSACESEIEEPPKDTTETQATTEETTSANDVVRVGIDKNSLADPEKFIDSMKDYGAEVKDMTDAGGYLLLFSKNEHKKLLDDKKSEVLKTLKEYEENEEHYVDSIEFNDDFRNLTIYVDKDKYSSTGSTTGNVVVASAVLSYQMFLEDGQKTVVEVIYTGTEDVVAKFVLPMNLSVEQ